MTKKDKDLKIASEKLEGGQDKGQLEEKPKKKKSFFVSTSRPKPKKGKKMVTTHDLPAQPPSYYGGKPRPKGRITIVATHDLDSNGVLIKKKEVNDEK